MAGIEFNESIRAVWFFSFPGGDWLGSVSACEDGNAELTYRFRYYRSELAWDGKDKKKWYRIITAEAIDGVLDKTHQCVTELQQSLRGGNLYEMLRGEQSLHDFMLRFQALPFVHARQGFFQSKTLSEEQIPNQYLLRRKATGAPLMYRGEPLTLLAENDVAARVTARSALKDAKLHVERATLSLVRIEERGPEITVPWSERVG